jgi:hypothetical protein
MHAAHENSRVHEVNPMSLLDPPEETLHTMNDAGRNRHNIVLAC